MGVYDSSKRIFYYDMLRVIAIFLVVLCHVSTEFCKYSQVGTFRWYSAALYMDIGTLGVPIFLMISGALLLNKDYELSDFMKRRFSRILIPFVFWALLLPICKMIFLNHPWTFAEYYNLLFFDQYWFVWMLIGAYLLLPILNSFVRDYEIKGLEYILIIWFISMFLLRDLPFDLFRNIVSTYTLGWVELFAGYFGYMPLGYYLSVKKFKWDDRKLYLIGLAIFLIFTIINMSATIVNSPKINDVAFFSYNSVISTMQAIGLFLFIEYFSRYCEKNRNSWKNKIYSFFKDNNHMSKIILSISICSYGIYLTHYFVLYPLIYISTNYIGIFTRNPIILPIIWFFIVIMAWILILIISKIPILKQFSGAH